MNRCLYILMAIVWMTSFQIPTSLALPDSEKTNLREGCRQSVGGEYISTYDSLRASKNYQSQLQQMSSRMSVALKQAKAELKTITNKVERVSYDVQLADQVIQENGKVKALTATLALYQQQLETAADQVALFTEREKHLKKQIEAVFIIVRGRAQLNDYPTGVAYKAECPKYRHMCPLPVIFHDKLAGIDLKDEAIELCKRYISYSRSGSR